MSTLTFSDLRHPRAIGLLLLFLAVVIGVGAIIGLATAPGVWYAGLNKPPFNPPNWLFGPVWTTLYAAMALAVWRIGVASDRARVRAISFFVLQLIVNGIWTPVFFGLEAPELALAVIVVLIILLVETIVVFWRLDRPAGILLLPYLAWTLYATLLTASIAVLN